MTKKTYRRRKKLINSRLQLHLVAIFSCLACFAALFQVLILNRSILKLAERSGDSGSRLAAEIPTLLFGNLAITLAVLLPLMLVVGVLVTHRIAGPVYRFEQHLGAIARGEDPGVCRIREGDELQELCQIINQAVERLKADGGRGEDAVAEEAAAASDESERQAA